MNTAAVLACGLPEESRIVRNRTGMQYSSVEMMLAGIFDRVSLLLYAQTKDAKKNRNRPKSLLEEMTRDRSNEAVAFESAEGFEAARQRILHKGGTA